MGGGGGASPFGDSSGGGGGGGYYGGGGGAGYCNSNGAGGGGGGGSSFSDADDASFATDTTGTPSLAITPLAPPAITSANHATFAVGSAGSFTVTTTAGEPPATTITTGSLPAWASFTDNGDGSAVLAGTPPAGSGGVYPITIKASNGATPDAQQSFTLTVNQPPAITSADHTTFAVGSAGSFTVTMTAGHPTATTLTKTGLYALGRHLH